MSGFKSFFSSAVSEPKDSVEERYSAEAGPVKAVLYILQEHDVPEDSSFFFLSLTLVTRESLTHYT